MQNLDTKNSIGFGSLEGSTLGDFYVGDETLTLDTISDIETISLVQDFDFPELPTEKPLTPAELELIRIEKRQDKLPSPPDENLSLNLNLKFMKPPEPKGEEKDGGGDDLNSSKSSANKVEAKRTSNPSTEHESRSEEQIRKSLRIIQSRTKIENYGDSQGSINKIKLPKVDDSNSGKPAFVEERDEELASLAKALPLFSIEDVADYQIVSPTSAEFIAQYYRILIMMITKITLNELAPKETELDGLWVSGKPVKTIGMSKNFVFVFDQIYGYCTQDNVLKSLRSLYEEKKVYFSEMTTHQIMGAGHGISSAQQATLYLEKMVAVSISSTISMLSYKRHMFKIRTWFEDTVPRTPTVMVYQNKAPSKSALLGIIQLAVSKSSKEQALKFANDNSVYVKADHHCLLFAKRYLNAHMNVQIPNAQLQLSALIFLMSGASYEQPKLGTIGYDLISKNLEDSETLSQALVEHTYESHRHCYPINELSKF